MVRAVVVFWMLIFVRDAMAQTAFSTNDIMKVQALLLVQGYDVGTVDGTLSEKTKAAIRQYEADWNLPQTAEISRDLIDRIKGDHPDTEVQWIKIENSDCNFWETPRAQGTVSWTGGCTGGRASGTGTLTVRFVLAGEARADRYEGELRDGKLDGQGVYTMASGILYEGEFRDGKFHGQGILTSPDGVRYEGRFWEGQPYGEGATTLAGGDRNTGDSGDGELNGQGSATAQSAPTTDDIRTVQQALADAHYDVGEVDGRLGNMTAAAIRQYQSDWELPETGEISRDLIDRLRRTHPATQPQWLKIENSDCTFWEAPRARGVVSWTGGCTGGKVSGTGTLTLRFVQAGDARADRYEGELRDGMFNGRGVLTEADGDRYEGEFRDNNFNGQGVFTYADGSRSEGEFRDGELNGQGVYTYTDGSRYEGEFRDGEPNGRGVLTVASGSRYEGEFRDGKFNGQGVFTYADGSRYEGEFRDGKFNGQGVLTFADGGRYEGEFRDDKFNGQGVLTFADGDRYEGEFRDGRRNGQGVLTFANGNRYEGEFRDSEFSGQGVYAFADGGRYEGEFRDGKRNGQGVEFFADGSRYKGAYRNGTPNGRGTLTKEGADYSGNWTDGCLRLKSSKWAINTTLEACGF